MPAQTESPVKDTQQVAGAAKGAKSAYDTAKTAKTVIQAASAGAKAGSGPAGWILLAKQLAPTIKKFQAKARKMLAGAVAFGLYLLYLLALKIAGLLAGLAFGAITGLPLLIVFPPAYFAWTAYWGYRGWTHPLETIHLATHPWALITKPLTTAWNLVKGGFSRAGEGVSGGASNVGGAIQSGISSGFGSIGSAIGSAAGAVGGFFTGLAAATWNGLVGAGGAIAGGIASAAGGLWGALSNLSIPTSATTVPIAAGLGSIAVGGTIVGITTATSFFDPSREIPQDIPVLVGDNEAFTISKTVSPTRLDNEALSGNPEITFNITLEAKSNRLLNITITDNLTVTSTAGTITVNRDINNNPISPPCGGLNALNANTTWTCQFKVRTQPNWRDSLVNNAVTVSATAEGALEPTLDSADAALAIGNAPIVGDSCPSGWPMTGNIQQGPDGTATHNQGYEAIDIGNFEGTPIYATFSGTIHYTSSASGSNQSLKLVPLGDCIHARTNNRLIDVRYVHLSLMIANDGQVVNRGDLIAESGRYISNPHLHYNFNPSPPSPFNRDFPIEPPYIPLPVDRDCTGESDCNMSITASYP